MHRDTSGRYPCKKGCFLFLSHCGLVTPEIWVNIDSGNGFVAWRHQGITWTSVHSSSVKSSDLHPRNNFTRDASAINHWNYLETYLSKISFKSHGSQRVNPMVGEWVNRCDLHAYFVVCYNRRVLAHTHVLSRASYQYKDRLSKVWVF